MRGWSFTICAGALPVICGRRVFRVAMDFTGHVTRAMFDRYNITDAEQMRQAQIQLDEYLRQQIGERKVRAIR